MQPYNMKSFAIASVTAFGFLLATVPLASAQNVFQCTGTIGDGRTINSSLVVPANAICELDNVTVIGNVQVGTGAGLFVTPSTGQRVAIDGNIVADGCGFVDLEPGGSGVISVEGNVKIQNCTNFGKRDASGYSGNVTISGNFVCSNNYFCFADSGIVQGNLTVDNNIGVGFLASVADVVGNQVSGNVDVSGNTGIAAVVSNNRIGGNLRCSNNSANPVDEGIPNTVSGHKLGQCSGL